MNHPPFKPNPSPWGIDFDELREVIKKYATRK